MYYFNNCLKIPDLVGGSKSALDNTLLIGGEQDRLDTWLFPFEVLIKTKQKSQEKLFTQDQNWFTNFLNLGRVDQ